MTRAARLAAVLAVSALAAVLAVSALACGPGPDAREPTPPDPSRAVDGPGDGDPADGSSADADALRIAAVERAVDETRDVRHQCWSLAAADDFRVAGAMILRLTFAAGATAAVEVIADEPGDPRLTTCIVELYRAYKWPAVFEPGQSIELPLRFRAPRMQYTVTAGHVEPATLADGKLDVRVLMDARNTGNGALSMSLLKISGGLDVALHRHTSAELLYVRAGRGVVYGLDGAKKGVRVSDGQGIYIPAGVAHGFVHEGDAPIELIQVYAPAGPEGRFKGGPPVGTTPVPAAEIRRPPRRFPRPLVSRAPRTYPIAGGDAQVTILFDAAITGDERAYLGVLEAQPGVVVPPHAHPGSTEALLVLSGDSRTTIDGDVYPTGAGVAIQIPAGIEHAYEVVGDQPVRVLQVYTPAGPEQRFKPKG